jgi:hypothetical protein
VLLARLNPCLRPLQSDERVEQSAPGELRGIHIVDSEQGGQPGLAGSRQRRALIRPVCWDSARFAHTVDYPRKRKPRAEKSLVCGQLARYGCSAVI